MNTFSSSGVLSTPKLSIRPGLKDIWNAHMAQGATFGPFDIPYCPTTANSIPTELITWDEAKAIYKSNIRCGILDFHYDGFVCFYIDDNKFDGPKGVWHDSGQALKVLQHFAGVITPDFSTYQDFPEAIKIYATYRMRMMGYWFGQQGIPVINNVRWGTPESYRYCFVGIPTHSIVSIGTVGGSPRKIEDRERFEDGLNQMVHVLSPHTIIVYGSAHYSCFEKLKESGINIVSFQSKTAIAYERRKHHE